MWLLIGCGSLVGAAIHARVACKALGKMRYIILAPFPLWALLIYISLQLHFVVLPKEGCEYNIRQIGAALQLYASENGEQFPASRFNLRRANVLNAPFFDNISDMAIFRCPQDSSERNIQNYSSYWYTGIRFASEDDILQYIHDGGTSSAENGLVKPELLRTMPSVDKSVPVLIEIPRKSMWHGCHVLFLDGHIECIIPGKKWPLTERIVSLLNSRPHHLK